MKGLLKTVLYLGVLCSVTALIQACQSAAKTQSVSYDTVVVQKSTGIESLDQFLSGFETAVLSHNSAQVLNYLDKDYKKEQYEKQMKFNTDSFMNAFFSSYQMEKSAYKILFNKITKISRTEAKVLAGTYSIYSVTYMVWTGSISQSVVVSVFSRLDKGILKHSIYGPVR
jgi:outer membrane biogenesis lipoprotein LolB